MGVSWRDLLAPASDVRVVPWTGGRRVSDRDRAWAVEGRLPQEHGWHAFRVDAGRRATWDGPGEPVAGWEDGREQLRGYLVGNRLIPDGAAVEPDAERLAVQTVAVHLAERGLERFSRALVARDPGAPWVWVRAEFPLGPEAEVDAAFVGRRATLDGVRDVPPALDLAFRFTSRERWLAEERRAAAERRRREEELLGTAEGRRELAATDFDAAARSALRGSGAELLDVRDAHGRHEKVVQFRFLGRRFECVVDRRTLRIVDAGICLNDYESGTKGDARFTLESLPGVIDEAIRADVLVVFRHVEGA